MPRRLATPRFGSRAFALLLLFALTACAHPKAGGDHLYVSDEQGDAVVAIDPVTGSVVDHIAAGPRPRGLALSPDGTTLYVAVSGSPIVDPAGQDGALLPPDRAADGVVVIDLRSSKATRILHAGEDPEVVVPSRDGRRLYVSNHGGGAVSEVAVDGSRAPITSKVGAGPAGVALSRDGKTLFVACEASDHVAVLDARTLRLIRTVTISGGPRALLASRDDGHIYVSVESGGKLAILSAADGKLLKLLDLALEDEEVHPIGMVEAADGHLFVTTGRYGAVLEVDPQEGTIVHTIANVGQQPSGIGLAADGATLVTANGPSGDVSLISRASGKVVRKLNVGQGPWGVAGPARSGAQ